MKAYLRYVPTTTFGVVASSSQCTDVLLDGKGKRATTACLEEACTFDLRQGSKVRVSVGLFGVLWIRHRVHPLIPIRIGTGPFD